MNVIGLRLLWRPSSAKEAEGIGAEGIGAGYVLNLGAVPTGPPLRASEYPGFIPKGEMPSRWEKAGLREDMGVPAPAAGPGHVFGEEYLGSEMEQRGTEMLSPEELVE